VGEIRNTYIIVVQKPERNVSIGRFKHRWKGNIKSNLKEVGERVCIESFWLKIGFSSGIL
jgi:hypothetical protein